MVNGIYKNGQSSEEIENTTYSFKIKQENRLRTLFVVRRRCVVKKKKIYVFF